MVSAVQRDLQAVISAEINLLRTEMTTKFRALGIAIAFGAVAAVLALYMLGFLLGTIRDVLDLWMPRWTAELTIVVVLLVAIGILVLLAKRMINRGTPPVPERTIDEARATMATVKGTGE
jgi:hypothetical protein